MANKSQINNSHTNLRGFMHHAHDPKAKHTISVIDAFYQENKPIFLIVTSQNYLDIKDMYKLRIELVLNVKVFDFTCKPSNSGKEGLREYMDEDPSNDQGSSRLESMIESVLANQEKNDKSIKILSKVESKTRKFKQSPLKQELYGPYNMTVT
ncbi:hypothetical protein RND71_001747 [Anisodus tanguticus]|uniref:Uncharacterized protein n=1 Tax=Anisodus tanguticus TaxID=243964 RepID=A0AAE1VYN1_9SOLA|nr:hypothetical protein RND71_001747 [Anisodus tanguticus]